MAWTMLGSSSSGSESTISSASQCRAAGVSASTSFAGPINTRPGVSTAAVSTMAVAKMARRTPSAMTLPTAATAAVSAGEKSGEAAVRYIAMPPQQDPPWTNEVRSSLPNPFGASRTRYRMLSSLWPEVASLRDPTWPLARASTANLLTSSSAYSFSASRGTCAGGIDR